MKCSRPLFISLVLLLTLASTAVAQDGVIRLSNPSFEDMPRHSHAPRSWTDCGFPGESPPDIQPDYTFQVNKAPIDGISYLGMVVRDNDTWESVAQQLNQPFQANQCYEFSIFLARSTTYVSQSRISNEIANYVTPAKLRVWGGFGLCDKRHLLGESPLVSNEDWQQYSFKLEPDASYTHVVFEVFYKTPTLFPYNGNILLDRASDITPIPCEQEVSDEPIDEPIVQTTPRAAPPQPTPSPVPTRTPPPAPDETEPEPTLAGVRRADLSTGQTIRIENLQFEADSSRILDNSLPALEELHDFLLKNNDVIVEIGGHTNGWADRNYAERLSTARAQAVANFLTSRGIARTRVKFKGYGKSQPIDTNATAEGRRRNQRVEIKILELGG